MKFNSQEYEYIYNMRKKHLLIFSIILMFFVCSYLKYHHGLLIIGIVLSIPVWLFGLIAFIFARQCYIDVSKWDRMGINDL